MGSEARGRYWPATLILALGAVGLLWAWATGDRIRQLRVLHSLAILIVTFAALVAWLAFFSRLRRGLRLGVPLAVLVAGALAAALFRIEGVTGDFVPIVRSRWAARPTPLPAPAAHPAGEPRVGAKRATPASEAGGADASAADQPGAAVASAPTSGDVRPALTESVAAEDRATRNVSDAVASASPAAPAAASDYPQFQGPTRDAVVRGVRLARDWSARPPRLVWRQPVGQGWSGFAVAGDLAITQEQRGAEERVVAYALESGAVRWSHGDPTRYETVIAGVGPRATPAIAKGRVFTVGATGILNALEAATGRRLWSRQIVEESAATVPEWGKSNSPLVVGERVIVSAGGPQGRSLVAYEAATGAGAWSAGDDAASYSSPRLATLAGREQVVILNRASVVGHDPATGALLWQHAWPGDQPSVALPLPLPGDRLLVSAGYGVGSKLFAVSASAEGRLTASLQWESLRLKSKFANLVHHEGFVYGLDDGVLTCLDPATGERRWKAGRLGHGQLLLVEGLLLVQSEGGEIVLLEPDPTAPRELARFQALAGKVWNPPALAGHRLLVRSDSEAALYELPVE